MGTSTKECRRDPSTSNLIPGNIPLLSCRITTREKPLFVSLSVGLFGYPSLGQISGVGIVVSSYQLFNTHTAREREREMQDLQPRTAKRMNKLGTETAFAVSLEAAKVAESGKKVFPFHIGDLNFASPSIVAEAMNKAIAEGKTGYCPGAGILPLRKRLAEVVGATRGVSYGPENVSIQSGGKPVIPKFLSAIMDEGDEVLYPSPGYPIYESQINYLGGVCKPYIYKETETGFVLDMDNLRKQITNKTKIFIYNNYQNPMGKCSFD